MRKLVVRLVYISILFAFGTWLFNTFAAGFLYPYGEGIVMGDLATVAVEFVSTVQNVNVAEGSEVKKGDVVAKTTSQLVVDERARLSAALSERQIKAAEMHVRKRIIDATLKEAESREHTAANSRDQLDKIDKLGFLPILTQTAAAAEAYRGRVDASTLRIEGDALDSQIKLVDATVAQTEDAIRSLAKLHDNGQVRALVDGVVSKVSVQPGSVTLAGAPMIEMVGTKRFVLAYYQVGRIYSLKVGQKVQINTGEVANLTGTITRVNVIASALPREFQGTLVPQERRQLVRIEFDANQTLPPFFTKVSVY